MTIQGTVYNADHTLGLTGAHVTVVDSGGALADFAADALSDADGNFSITSADLDHGGLLLFALPGFQSVMIAPADFNKTGEVELSVPGSSSILPYALAGLGVAAIIAIATHHHKIGETKPDGQWMKIALGLGITAGVFFGVIRPMLIKLGVLSSIGTATGQTFSADTIIGKTLIALVDVPAYSNPMDSATPTGTFKAGTTIGVVDSYLDANTAEDRSGLWWEFVAGLDQQSLASTTGNFYVPHRQGYFDIQALVDQGALTTAQATALAANASKPLWQQEVEKYIPWVIGGALAVGVVKGLINKVL